MSRISIDVSPEEHRKLKAIAALKGKSMKDYLLEGKIDIGAGDEEKALVELEALLDARIDHHGESQLKGRSSASAILQDILESR
ncbi:antitoxin [Haloferula chungangensis]|uniref:Antitoxin n=1 Tax=Haloferula chungangensis TaxID=1048331 RepID=A0ABW2LEC5_9BACT